MSLLDKQSRPKLILISSQVQSFNQQSIYEQKKPFLAWKNLGKINFQKHQKVLTNQSQACTLGLLLAAKYYS